jgi:hypothetical protein
LGSAAEEVTAPQSLQSMIQQTEIKSEALPGRPVPRSATAHPVFAPPVHAASIARLQHSIGNQAVQRVLQKKLVVNQPGDVYEKEADRMAEVVMSQASRLSPRTIAGRPQNATLQRKCSCGSACSHCEEEAQMQRKESSALSVSELVQTAPLVVHDVLRSSGSPMEAETQSFMESRFGRDFSSVRIHTDPQAAESACAVNAMAYTVGQHVVFGEGRYAPFSQRGRNLLAHELTHVVQQSSGAGSPGTIAPRVQRQNEKEEKPLESDEPMIHCLEYAQPWLKPLCLADLSIPQHFKSPAPAPGVFPPSPPVPSPSPTASKKLNFYHGTRWSIAVRIPNDVKPIGRGDFAAGFYTHYDADDSKALKRAVKWGCDVAKKLPPEPFAGVVRFGVVQADYDKLLAGGKKKKFALTRLDQKDYQQKQKEWLDFVTSYGREKDPVFNEKRKRWVHERRKSQPSLNYNIIEGPFYTPLKGTKARKPLPEEFKPYAEGQQLPQQVKWANDGIALLNSGAVEKELTPYDCKAGKPQDPRVTGTPATAPLSDQQIIEATDEAQFEMGAVTE